VDLENSHE
jgi:hypothetical protein